MTAPSSAPGRAKNSANRDLSLSADAEARARRLHAEATIIDGTALAYTLEEPYTTGLLEAGVSAAMVTVFVGIERAKGDHTTLALRNIDRALEIAARPGSNLRIVERVSDIARARAAGKFGVILSFQNASPIGDDLRRVQKFHDLGVRCIQLTYNFRNLIADGCIERHPGGLSEFGEEALHALQEAGIVADLSHVGDPSVEDALAVARKPLAFTHCNARALCDNPRNKTDAHIRKLASHGGIIGLNAFPAFVRDDGKRPFLADLLDHADHLMKVAGSGAVGMGLDFIEAWGEEEKKNLRSHAHAFGTAYDFPIGLERVKALPNLTLGLVARGYSDLEIRGILGENYLSLFRRTWKSEISGTNASA